jgi:hypothetical protein
LSNSFSKFSSSFSSLSNSQDFLAFSSFILAFSLASSKSRIYFLTCAFVIFGLDHAGANSDIFFYLKNEINLIYKTLKNFIINKGTPIISDIITVIKIMANKIKFISKNQRFKLNILLNITFNIIFNNI